MLIDRLRDAWLWRFRMDHGIPEPRPAQAPEEMRQVLTGVLEVAHG